MTKHGIAIRDRKTKELVEFIECQVGRDALRTLSGVRMNMSSDYKAEEEVIDEKEIEAIK